jgi:hypothetical protein
MLALKFDLEFCKRDCWSSEKRNGFYEKSDDVK